jgi:DNA invertase Pin-like site-specific DNA recombinase
MTLIRKYKVKDGTIKKRTYSSINGKRAESYRREQNRRYKAKLRQTHPQHQRIYPPSQADTLPLPTITDIIDEYSHGASINRISNTTGISRYILTKVINKYLDNATQPSHQPHK